MRYLVHGTVARYRRHAVAVAWTVTAAVVAVLLMPSPPGTLEQVIPGLDKIVHVGLFAALTGCWAVALTPRRSLWLALAIGVTTGLLTELAQHALPERTVSAADWLADIVGAALGTLAVRRWFRRRRLPEPG